LLHQFPHVSARHHRQIEHGLGNVYHTKSQYESYSEKGYKISTREILRENIESQLTDKYNVHDIDPGCWIQAIKHTVRINRILTDFIRTVKDTEEAKMLLIAVALGAYTDDADVAFWDILARIDPGGDVLGKAMITAAQVYNGPDFIDDLTNLQIMHGQTVYNIFEGGIFETVYVDNDQRGTFEFYIYSADHSFDK